MKRHKLFIKSLESNTGLADQLFSDIEKQFKLMRRVWTRMDSHHFEEMVHNLHKKLDEMEQAVKDNKLVSPSDGTDRSSDSGSQS